MGFNSDYFARALKVKRAERGWTQADLANKSGVSIGAIARHEMADTKPTFETVCHIADAFECATDDFWDRKAS